MPDIERVTAAVQTLRKMGHDDPSRLAGFERYALAGRWERAYALLYKSPICGARRSNGLTCLSSPKHGRRCARHGGGSIVKGARTQAGRDRIAAAQRERWRRWRQTRDATSPQSPSDGP